MSEIIEIEELGFPKSLIMRYGALVSELIDTKDLVNELNEQLHQCNVSGRNEQFNICKPPKFNDWLSDNFTKRTEYYYDKNSNNETYSIKEIESQYVMKFKTNI